MSEPAWPPFDEVLASARQGSPWALGALYRRFHRGLLRLLAVIAPNHAEDIASDVWLEVAGALPWFRGDERAFRGWLATTARRQVIDAHRRPGRRSDRTGGGLVDEPASESFIARVVSVLSPDQADVVLMRVAGGLDVEQVARLLGKQPGAVRCLQQRALRRLAAQLRPEVISA